MNVFTDAHIHLANLYQSHKDFTCLWIQKHLEQDKDIILCADAHNPEEFEIQNTFVKQFPLNIVSCYGIHPQLPEKKYADFLEKLLQHQQIQAIGETGFDVFTQEFSSHIEQQKEVWNIQLELAIQYKKPVIIHCRRALNYIFKDYYLLKKLPSVIFHSWSGSPVEAQSLLKRGINCFFSLGKGLLQGNKRMQNCVSLLAKDYLLFETDAPFQTLKGQEWTPPTDIELIYEQAAQLRLCDRDELKIQIYHNLKKAYNFYP